MSQKTVRVPSITCGHCVKTIEREVSELEGVVSVRGNHETKEVAFEWTEPETSWDAIRNLLREIEYEPED